MECPTTGTTSGIAQLVMSLVFAFGAGGYLGGNVCEISFFGHSQRHWIWVVSSFFCMYEIYDEIPGNGECKTPQSRYVCQYEQAVMY
jgi:hypothetical protein